MLGWTAVAGPVKFTIVLRAPSLLLAPRTMALVLGLSVLLPTTRCRPVIMMFLVALVKTFLAWVSSWTLLIILLLSMVVTDFLACWIILRVHGLLVGPLTVSDPVTALGPIGPMML